MDKICELIIIGYQRRFHAFLAMDVQSFQKHASGNSQNFREAQNRAGQTRFLQCPTTSFSIVRAQKSISTLDNRSTKTIEGVAETNS